MLYQNPVSKEYHRVGLEYRNSGNYAQAHEQFDEALFSPLMLLEADTLDKNVQKASITGDDGFTYAHEAISSNDPDLLTKAKVRVGQARAITDPLVSGAEFLDIISPDGHGTPKLGRRELFATHGRTISMLGRVGTIRQVMLNQDTRGIAPTAHRARMTALQPYGLAHDFLRLGNNGSHRVDNAMFGARQEILNGRKVHAGVWLGRALYGLGWTLVRDWRNIGHATTALLNGIMDVRSYDVARNSVFRRP